MKINFKILNHALKLRDFILDLIFPIRCLGCKSEGAWLCKKCFRKIDFKRQYCLECKLPDRFGRFCLDCGKKYVLSGVWIAADYDNPIISGLIKNLKYHFAEDIASSLGNILILFIHNLINQGRILKSDFQNGINMNKIKQLGQCPNVLFELHSCLIIPVPLHKRRQRFRGFNQAEKIASIVSSNLNVPLSTELIRIKYNKPQAGLNEHNRKHNLNHCFLWTGQELKNQPIILVDDVVTTGSTLNECAKALKKAGAGKIWGLVVAKG